MAQDSDMGCFKVALKQAQVLKSTSQSFLTPPTFKVYRFKSHFNDHLIIYLPIY